MNKTAIKNFAIWARVQLIEAAKRGFTLVELLVVVAQRQYGQGGHLRRTCRHEGEAFPGRARVRRRRVEAPRPPRHGSARP